MPAFLPFRALRYAPGTDLDAVIAPPYDVLSGADVEALEAQDPHNIVHIDVPRSGDDPYAEAARVLAAWVREGVLQPDDEPSFTIYRMSFTDATGRIRTISGVLGGLEVVDEGAGGVLPHERTTPKARTDRLDLTRATSVNLSPVWGLSLASGLTQALRDPGEPVGRMESEGVVHVVERITDPARLAEISAIIGSDDVLIADGHHRYAVSRLYRDEVHTRGIRSTEADFTLTFVNELIGDQLSVEAIHRVYSGATYEQVRAGLATAFALSPAPDVTPALLVTMEEEGRLVLLGPDGTAEWMTPRPGRFDHLRALDGAWLEDVLDPEAFPVSYQHGIAEVQDLVTSGDATAAVLIRPTTITEIERTAREGLLMPPKSTFFTPKLRTGLVLRPTAPLTEPVT